MSKHFDPRKVLRTISMALLERFFRERGQLRDVPWNDLAERDIEPIFEAWQALPDEERADIQAVFQEVLDLASPRGLSVLSEEFQRRHPLRIDEVLAWDGRMDRVLFVYLEDHRAFKEIALFARADALASGRYWVKRNDLPRGPLAVTPKMIRALQTEVSMVYWQREMRGRYCHVDHYMRANGAEYFFIYLDDYPDRKLILEKPGKFIAATEQFAFENVAVFTPEAGALEIHAPGGKRVWFPVQQAFCRAILGLDVDEADPRKPVYRLDHLLTPNPQLQFDNKDPIQDVSIVRMRLSPKTSPRAYIELKADLRDGPRGIARLMAHSIRRSASVASTFWVRQLGIRVEMMSEGETRPPTFWMNLSAPNHCDIKSLPDEQRKIGERILKLSGIIND